MRSLYLALLIGAFVAFTGCNQGTPGGDSGQNKPVLGGPAKGQFTVVPPTLGVTVKQGDTKTGTFSIHKGEGFGEDVTLKFDDLPKGVTTDPVSPMIKSSDKEINVTFKAEPDATEGKKEVKVVGHPTKGEDAVNKFTLTVEKK
jgi:hypothetical protein